LDGLAGTAGDMISAATIFGADDSLPRKAEFIRVGE
jgi:hypothetical protein